MSAESNTKVKRHLNAFTLISNICFDEFQITNFKKTVHEKSGEEKAQIIQMCKNSMYVNSPLPSPYLLLPDILFLASLFQHLDNNQLNIITDAMFPVKHEDGDVIIKQGWQKITKSKRPNVAYSLMPYL